MAKKKSNNKIPGAKLPPQNLEAENAVIGALLIDKDAILTVAEILTPEDFYDDRNGTIYRAILSLFEKRTPIDMVTLTDQLEKENDLTNIGGGSHIVSIVNSTPSAANVAHWANIVRNKAILRRLITSAVTITELGFEEDEDVSAVLDKAEQSLFAVSEKFFRQKFIPIKDILTEAFDRIDKIHKEKGALRGLPTGFRDLDAKLAGLQKADLLILAARPSMGKTSLALNIAEQISVEDKVPVAFFSLEMSKEQLVDRLISSQAGVDSWKLRTGNLSDDDFPKIGYAMGTLSEAPFFIDDSPGLTVTEIRAKARRLQMEHELGVIFVDYLQLIEGRSKSGDANRVQEISEISRSLKTLARELNVPVVALSQLSRAVEHRLDKRPQLSDLRESGCLAADTLIFNAENGSRRPIKELVGKKDLKILAVGKRNKLSVCHASKIFSTGRKKVFELFFASGKKIKATANHKFLTYGGWQRLDKLAVGDFLATPRIINFKSKKHRADFTDDQLVVLAHLISGGCYLRHQPLHYTSADKKSLDIVDRASSEAFGTINRLIKQKNCFHLYLSAPENLTRGKRNPIVKWLDKLGIFDQRSEQKRIPESVFQLEKSKIKLFLSHLFSTDGGITKSVGVWRLHYASKSLNLIYDVSHLLLRFGIHSRIKINRKKGYDPVYDLQISGVNDQLKFLDDIGIFGEKSKNVKLAIAELSSLNRNPNVDIVPKEVWLDIKQKFIALGWTTREFHSKMNWAYSGTQRYGNGLSRKRLGKIAEVLGDDQLSDLALSDLFWDKIKLIVPLGVEEVFDITVTSEHNFVANDILVHNSIEQDADVVMFIYRDDYYDENSEKKGISEILIRKHRNGPIGNVKLYFNAEQMRFRDLARQPKDSAANIEPED